MGFEDGVEQSLGRPCRPTDSRSKRTYELTSSIVPQGTSFHRSVEFECPPILFDPAQFSCCCHGLFPGPPELGAVNPDAVHHHGHTLRATLEDTQRLTGREIERVYVDKGYRGHDAPKPRRVFISGQKRGGFGVIKRELRRRSAVEPLIGHMKEEGHLGRCYLKGHAGDAANAILTAAGYNFRRILAWLRTLLLRLFLSVLMAGLPHQPTLNTAS
jgi:hypothetical protein